MISVDDGFTTHQELLHDQTDRAWGENCCICVRVLLLQQYMKKQCDEASGRNQVDVDSARKTILIVDDIADNLQLLRSILAASYRIKIATSGEKALLLADCSDPPDLILLDVMMPGMDGYQVCSEIKKRENTKNVPVIFVTALEDATDEEKGFAVGAVDYITKPIVPAIVLARVTTHLALSQALSDLEKQNAVLSENVRLREQVERIMRHDLKTPLTAFIGIPALLKRRSDLPADVMESIRMLEKSGVKMLDMINKSMDLYRMEAGTYQAHLVPVELVNIIEQIRFELSDHLRAKSVGLLVSVNNMETSAASKFHARGEETLCYSMLANIVKNAIEACPDNKTVRVGFFEAPKPHMTVNNPGTIPFAVRDKFLQKFASHGKVGGTGLGGYSARLMAETMGGSVSFTSDENSGTTITIDFAADLPAISVEHNIADLRALVIDDNAMLLATICEILRSIGLYRIEAVKDVASATEYLSSGEPVHLIVLDWNFAAASCREFFRRVGSDAYYAKVPLLVISSEPFDEEVRAAFGAGAVKLVSKPFSPDLLLKRVEEFMERMLQLGVKG
jgi:PleD family two-component response regulator